MYENKFSQVNKNNKKRTKRMGVFVQHKCVSFVVRVPLSSCMSDSISCKNHDFSLSFFLLKNFSIPKAKIYQNGCCIIVVLLLKNVQAARATIKYFRFTAIT